MLGFRAGGSPRAGLASAGSGLAWVWLASLRIWLDFGLISGGCCFWLSFPRILVGFAWIWKVNYDFIWISSRFY